MRGNPGAFAVAALISLMACAGLFCGIAAAWDVGGNAGAWAGTGIVLGLAAFFVALMADL